MIVLVIDNDTFSRKGIEHLVANEFSGTEIVSLSGFEGSRKILRKNNVNLVIAEIYHPQIDISKVYDFLNSIKAPLIVYTVFETPGYIKTRKKTIKNEDLFISKNQPIDVFLRAIKKASFEKYKANYINIKPDEFSPELILSAKERQLVTELLKGKSLSDISVQNGIRYASLVTMRRKVFEKCKINSLIDLFYYAKIYDL